MSAAFGSVWQRADRARPRPAPVSSLAARLLAITLWWVAAAHLAIAVTVSISDRPSSVRSYSTRGGTSAYGVHRDQAALTVRERLDQHPLGDPGMLAYKSK